MRLPDHTWTIDRTPDRLLREPPLPDGADVTAVRKEMREFGHSIFAFLAGALLARATGNENLENQMVKSMFRGLED